MRLLYRLLLRLYPRAFRDRYAEAICELADAEPASAGLRARAARWRFLIVDVLTSAARLRLRAFRNRRQTLPRLPDASRSGLMETLAHDVRYSVRQLVHRPGFTGVAVLSLALAIGGNSLIFGLLDGFVFNPFEYPEPDRLVAVGATFPKVSAETTYVEALSPAEYADIRRAQSFSSTASFDLGNRNISGGDVPERVFTALLLDDLFPVIGFRPHLGRGFTAEELAPRGPRVAIVSHRLWRSRFGADPGIVGRSIRVGGEATTVVGVMPPELLLIGADLWIPWGADTASMPRAARQFTILGRLAPGVSVNTANAELTAIAGRVQQEHLASFKEYDGWRLTATPWAAALLQDVRLAAFIILIAVGFVLLIACANLANLMLARASVRSREVAVRIALGAARWRIARQLLVESVLISVAGAALGVGVAYFGLPFAAALIPAQFQTLGLEATVSGRVLLWSVGLAAIAAVLMAVLPAWQATRTDPHETLKSDGRGAGAGRRSGRVRQALVVSEVALSVVLLLGAGLLMRSFQKLHQADPGFDATGIVTMRLTLPQQKYPTGAAMTSFFEELIRRVGAIPGVRSVSMASQFPPMGPFSSQIGVEGVPETGTSLPSANTTIASRDHFTTIGVPVLRGRAFNSEDTPNAPRRVIVNQSFVARFIKDRDPLATRIRIMGRNAPGPWTEIVGVVGDARNAGLGSPVRPEVFIPMEQGQNVWNQLFVLVRSEREAAAVIPAVRTAVASLDPEQPVYMIQTMDDAVAVSSFQQRVSATLIGIFAAVALTLAAVGIYGVMSYVVSSRTQEIGIRMAIGAQRSTVARLVMGQVARLTAAGLVVGVLLLMAASSALRGLLYGVTVSDPVTIAGVSLLLGGVALLAGWIPARRASRVDPIVALRYE